MIASRLIDNWTLKCLKIGEDHQRMIEGVTVILEEQFRNLAADIHRWKSRLGGALAIILKTFAFLDVLIEDFLVTMYCIQAPVANLILPTAAVSERSQADESIERFDEEVMAFEKE